jgi:hypothetical protein
MIHAWLKMHLDVNNDVLFLLFAGSFTPMRHLFSNEAGTRNPYADLLALNRQIW